MGKYLVYVREPRIFDLSKQLIMEKRTCIIVIEIATGQKSYQYYDRATALVNGRWYKSLRENGRPKYRVFIEKEK